MKELAKALKAHGCTGDRKERDGKKLRGWLGVEIVNPVGILPLAVTETTDRVDHVFRFPIHMALAKQPEVVVHPVRSTQRVHNRPTTTVRCIF